MNFNCENVENYLLYDTPLDNLFITEYMSVAKGDFVKVYLLALMYAKYKQPFDNDAIAKQLGLSAEGVADAWDYWESEGLVKKVFPDSERKDVYEIVFLNIRELAFGRGIKKEEKKLPALNDKELRSLFRDIEAASGRLLEASEPEEIAVWISEYGMDPQVVLFAYTFCANNRKSTRSRYVGAILKDWRAKGLSSRAQVEEYLSENDKHYDMYKKIFKELGFHRNPTEPEKVIMNSWFDKLGYGMDKILEACERTTGISSPNINYVNSVLCKWYEEENSEKQAVSKENAFATINRMYEEIRADNAERTRRNRAEISVAIPRIPQIMEEIRDAGVNVSRLALSGGTEAAGKIKRRMAELYAERKRLLVAHGYSEDAYDAVYSCKKCKDTGMLDDGSRCSCYAEKLNAITRQEGK